MSIELGLIALIIALLFALIQSFVPLAGSYFSKSAWMAIGKPLAIGQFLLVGFAFAVLTAAFVAHDFSVSYVADHSNRLLPLHFRFTAVWSSHEGSLLLAVLILTAWTAAVGIGSRALPERFTARLLAALGLVNAGSLAFLVFTSNPFTRRLPAPIDGHDMNPLLQDPGMIVHPPLLYVGYFGMAVPYAFAIAAMLEGRVDREWVRWVRPWTNTAWAFLTIGIALGSWWAYYELGWGGWWFWDPVENASFMPWLVGIALIHSQAVTAKRGSLQSWTLLLSIMVFCLSLLGGFLVRSGVITSVHAFASDPTRGVYLLGYLLVIGGLGLLLFALRAHRLPAAQGFSSWSRESLILINNLFLCAAAAMVLLGTMYPLISEGLGLGKISVGPPYFGSMFYWLMVPIVLLMPIAPMLRWGRGWSQVNAQRPRLGRLALLGALPIGLVTLAQFAWQSAFALTAAVWIVWLSLRLLTLRLRGGQPADAGFIGMTIAHLGIAVFLVGASMADSRAIERDLRMEPGDSFAANNYQFTFNGTERIQGPNYLSDRGSFTVSKGGSVIAELHPEKRLYSRGGAVMTEAAIDPGLTRDVYVSLGEPLNDNGQAWAVRIYIKPFVRWIWLGALLMAIGGLTASLAHRRKQRLDASLPSNSGAAQAAA